MSFWPGQIEKHCGLTFVVIGEDIPHSNCSSFRFLIWGCNGCLWAEKGGYRTASLAAKVARRACEMTRYEARLWLATAIRPYSFSDYPGVMEAQA